MIDRMQLGEVPPKHHLALRGPSGGLRWEEALTRRGFDGPYTLLYHLERPHAQRPAEVARGWRLPQAVPPRPLRRRHYRTQDLRPAAGPAVDARVPLLFNEDVVLSVAAPTEPDPVYLQDGDADELWFVAEGGGVLRTALGDVRFEREDYLYVPKGLLHRFLPDAGAQRWVSLEFPGGLGLLDRFRNEAGQLRMDAPLCHRDFRRPAFTGPRDEGIREILVKRGGAFHGFRQDTPPLDVVGWDGAVWPFACPILAFQPRVSSVHLPPTWHGTFAARGVLVCSFVPRPLDFHPDAVPCPYPHSSVDVDEAIFYQRGEFTSRRGVGPGSVSHHPAGVMHGPHPGAYEGSIGAKATSEVAVMLDCHRPLQATAAAAGVEDAAYDASFAG